MKTITMLCALLFMFGCTQQPRERSLEEAAMLETAQDMLEEQALKAPSDNPQ